MKNNLQQLSKFAKGLIILIAIMLVGFYVFHNWLRWFPDREAVLNIECSNSTNTDDWNSCLKNKNVTPNDSDIRKQCAIIAEYAITHVPTSHVLNQSKNDIYNECIHGEGLAQ